MRIGNIIVSVVLIIMGGLILGASAEFPARVSNAPGPGYYPSLLAYGFIAMAVLLLVEAIARKDYAPAALNSPGARRAYAAMGLGLGYYLLLHFGFGYLLSSFVFSVALLLLLRFRGVWMIAAPIVIPVCIYILFVEFLETPLPEFEIHDGVASFLDGIYQGVRNFVTAPFK